MARKHDKDPTTMSLLELKRSMTPKQLKFAELVAKEGISKVEAFRRVYDTTGYKSSKALSVSASKTALNGKVQVATDLIRQAYEIPALRDAASTRAFVLQTLHEIASTSERDSDRLAAAIALGKTSTVGLFVDRKEVVHRTAGKDTEAEVVSRLTALAAQMAEASRLQAQEGAIDVQPIHTPELSLLQSAPTTTDVDEDSAGEPDDTTAGE